MSLVWFKIPLSLSISRISYFLDVKERELGGDESTAEVILRSERMYLSSEQNIATKISYTVESLNGTECGAGAENEAANRAGDILW